MFMFIHRVLHANPEGHSIFVLAGRVLAPRTKTKSLTKKTFFLGRARVHCRYGRRHHWHCCRGGGTPHPWPRTPFPHWHAPPQWTWHNLTTHEAFALSPCHWEENVLSVTTGGWAIAALFFAGGKVHAKKKSSPCAWSWATLWQFNLFDMSFHELVICLVIAVSTRESFFFVQSKLKILSPMRWVRSLCDVIQTKLAFCAVQKVAFWLPFDFFPEPLDVPW